MGERVRDRMGERQSSDDVRSRSQSGFPEIKVFIRVSTGKRREKKKIELKESCPVQECYLVALSLLIFPFRDFLSILPSVESAATTMAAVK
jgi:hypothetical protein